MIRAEEDRPIKQIVLKLLHLNGVIAFDAEESELDEETEAVITPAPEGNWN